jgi:hypothetical protein
MSRSTMTVLAMAAALTGGLTADAAARATAHSGWDGLGDGGAYRSGSGDGAHTGAEFGRSNSGGPGKVSSRGSADQHFPTARGHRISPASAIDK